MYLGVDLGTTNVKAVAVDDDGRVAATGCAPVERFATPDGGIEQDIEQIWTAACAAIRQAAAGPHATAIRALGVSSQGGAMQLLDAAQKPVGRVTSWLDGRGRSFDLRFTEELGADLLSRRIGHGHSEMTIGQWLRLRERAPELLKSARHLAFVGDVIVGRLCGRRAHDATSLAIAMLYNPWLKRADPEILCRLGLNEDQLPELLPATTPASGLLLDPARHTGLPRGIPVLPAVHDQYAAAVGAGSIHETDVSFGAGTAWVLLANASKLAPPVTRDAFVCSHLVPGLFGHLLSIHNGGSVIQWVLHLSGRADAPLLTVDGLMREAPPGCEGLTFWPWLVSAAGANREGGRISGVKLNHRLGHLLRAAVEGLACEVARRLRQLSASGFLTTRLVMCGSASASRVTPQIIADVTGLPVACVDTYDVGAFGAAILARAAVEPSESIAEIAACMAAPFHLAEPGENAAFYRELSAKYFGACPFTPAPPSSYRKNRGLNGANGDTSGEPVATHSQGGARIDSAARGTLT
jgi:xylulokinase